MPEAKRIPLELKRLRERAGRGRSKLADDLGLSVTLLGKLEDGHGNPRLSTIFRLCLVLARYLKQPPVKILNKLIAENLYDDFEEIRIGATSQLTILEHHNSLRAKQQLRSQSAVPPEAEPVLEHVSYGKFRELYAKSRFSQAELGRLTGLSERRLNQIFAVSASSAGNMSLWVFLRLAAALSPVHGASIKETALYLINRELEELTRLYEREQQMCK